MASPSENLAKSLESLRKRQGNPGTAAIRSRDLSRTDRERLLKNGFLKEVIKGWYVPARPDETRGESTAWYATFWTFCAAYLSERFGSDWSLSPEQSLELHAGNWTVPAQLLVRAKNAGNKVTNLPHGTSLFDVKANLPSPEDSLEVEGLRLFSIEYALVAAGPTFFKQSPTSARAALAMLRDASPLLSKLLEGGHSAIAGRLAGACRNVGRKKIANEIVETMQAAGYSVRESDPFEDGVSIQFAQAGTSPHLTRIRLLWQTMRESVIETFPPAPGLPKARKRYLKSVDEVYANDAYNSLSIEGYKVTPALIERVRTGDWNPDGIETDRAHRDAMARGYWQSFQAVRSSVEAALQGANPGQVADSDHGSWYRKLFAPSVTAGLLAPADLAGYRRGQVYIRGSMHVPVKREAVAESMEALFALLSSEESAPARVVLGHFFFVFIHPYMDGNGRIGRFLMNLMLASGGYPWTVIPVEERTRYMQTLEEASVRQNIKPFAQFIATLVRERLESS